MFIGKSGRRAVFRVGISNSMPIGTSPEDRITNTKLLQVCMPFLSPNRNLYALLC